MRDFEITKDFVKGLSNSDIIRLDYGEKVDTWWGHECVGLSREDIDWLVQGKLLNFNDGEYSHTLFLK